MTAGRPICTGFAVEEVHNPIIDRVYVREEQETKTKDKWRTDQESHDRQVLRQAQLHAAQAVDGWLSLADAR